MTPMLAVINSNGELKRVRADSTTHTLQTIDYAHHEIHAGSHYYIEGHTTLEDGDDLFVKLVTPDTAKWAHFVWDINSTGVLETTLDEGATGGMTGGTGPSPLNNNRNLTANTSGMTITTGVSDASSYDTRVSNQKFGVAANPTRVVGGGATRENEIILKQNTIYLRSFTSTSADNVVSFKASWYEHENR